ncbi:MAG: putative sulfate exporter family transporter, partial [Rhodoglobus sp.]
MITGLVVAVAAFGVAWLVHLLVPAIPLLTAAVALGIIAAQVPPVRRLLDGPLKPGLGFASRHLMRAGIVLLGLKLSLLDIVKLGWLTIVLVVAIVIFTFWFTWGLGRLVRLPGREPLLLAAGFSICGASAIGAMAAATRSKTEDQATPVAMVTLFGTLAIAVLPALRV